MRRSVGVLSIVISASILVGLACSGQSQQPQESSESTKIGTNVGERVPEFIMRLTDRSTASSADLVTEGKPVFLYFFATW